MDKLFFKLFLIILLSAGAFYYSFPWYHFNINAPFTGNEYKLGLDLQGGVELDYKVDLEEAQKSSDYNMQKESSILEGLKSIIDKRVEALNISDSVITTANYGGEKHIIVQIPLKGENKEENELNIKRAKEAIGRVMKIEFKEKRGEITKEDLAERKKIAEDLLSSLKASEYDFGVDATKYKDTYENVDTGTMTGTLSTLSSYFKLDKSKVKDGLVSEILTGTGITKYTLSDGKLSPTSDEGYWIINVKNVKDDILTFDYAFILAKPSEWKPAQDSKGRVLNDKYFVNSSVQYSQAFQPMVELTFNSEGAEIFGELTTRLIGQPIAIFVGGNMLTAPTVNDKILNGKAVITGNYSPEEAKTLSQDINTGVVPAPIYLTSEKTIDSKLGTNSLGELVNAGIIGFLIILLFLVIVYRVSGLLAGIALGIYLFIVLFIVKISGITLTLASIAGLILSVGMAIDANILIFERIKDELHRGTKLKKAVKEGFDRSWSAIWDSNLTGIIIALVLFIFGVNLIKGFGLMLGIGLVVSLFSAMFISRIFILLLIKKEDIHNCIFIGRVKK